MKNASVVAEVGRPPVLRIGHQRIDVVRQGVEVEAVELLGVVEVGAHRVGLRMVLAEDSQVQAVGPPMLVRRDPNSLVGGFITGHVAVVGSSLVVTVPCSSLLISLLD